MERKVFVVQCSFLVLLTFCIGVIGEIGTSTPVSFFGSSHINVRLQEARSSSDIYFRLRTRRADSMLFLAAGRTDYCLLVLDAGRLKVHINLGAGETEIASEAPFLLNDMAWHSVNLTRRGSQLSLQIDNHLTKANLPSRFLELNIHFGIWLGGLAGFNEIFLGNLPSFRGCMSHITYNQEDLILRAKTHSGQIHGIAWNCSDEFEASTKDAFSLVSETSYVISRVAISRQGVVIKMNVRPYESDGLIFYVSGLSSKPDYLALELKQSRVRFVAEMGSGPLHVVASMNLTLQQWYSVLIQVTPYSMSIAVNNQSWVGEPTGRGGSRHLDVSEMVYLGLEESKKSKIRAQGLIDRSFRGCIKELYIDGKPFGLPEMDVTSNITKGCGTFNCQNSSSCSSNTGGVSTLNKTRNDTTSDVITVSRDLLRIVAQTDLGELEIMRVSPVHVAEGDSVIITPRHLAITLDLSKFGIRESGVLFRISKGPQQGRIEVTTRTSGSTSGISATGRSSETFSLLDVGAGRVRYWHNGAESVRDSVELSLRLIETSGFLLPAYLQDERVVTLPIEITAVNDPPEIRLVPGGVLRLAEGTKIRLMPEVITSLDPDTTSPELVFSLISVGTAAEKKGFLELSSEPGKPIRNFTQADLEAGRVWFVDQGLSSSKMALKVTDGSSISSISVLRIETFHLRISPEVNTGLEVANVMGTASSISSSNLSFTSNAGDQGLVVEYHVISPPKAGIIQLRRTNGQWTTTDHFTQLDLQAGRLRYLLQRPSEMATEDEFAFHVALAETKMPSEFRFRFRIVSLRLEQLQPNTVFLNGTTQGPLALLFRTFPLQIPPSSIKYTLVHPPRFGYLTHALSPAHITSFSQADLTSSKVIYSFKLTPFSSMTDYFLFNVSASHLEMSLTSGPFRCDIHHSTRKKPSGVTIKPLVVTEAGRETLSAKLLRIRISGESEQSLLYFNITSGPSHGSLEKEREYIRLTSSLSSSSSTFYSVDRFSSVDLDKGRLSYRHDGSETPRDKIELVAYNSEFNFMFAFQLDIIIKGVNNHSPKRSPTATLSVNVVINGRRILTPEILDYIDEDWDSERGALKYSTKGNPSGGAGGKDAVGHIYDQTNSLRPLFQWTQADIDSGKLVFKHEGMETQGSLHFWVTDGKFIVNGTLGISAAAPWVKTINSTTLIGKKGSIGKLNEQSIKVDTNVDVDMSKILIRILDGPKHGFIKINQSAVSNFTLNQMSLGSVSYENVAVTDVGRDGFRYEAVVNNGAAQSGPNEFEISIYPEAYWTPLTVGANGSVTINENSSAIISQTSLHIINPHIPPTDIVYTLTRPPRHGYLAIDPSNSHEETDDYVSMWDQTVINDGRLRYVQSESNKTHDSMEFHVTNGVQTLPNLRLNFVIVPATLLLASTSLTLNEGGSSILNLTHLHSSQSYFSDKLVEVKITQQPKHGTVGFVSRPEIPIQTFPYPALQDGKIVYTHDGSETTEDDFSVVAVAQLSEEGTRRLSQEHMIRIKIVSTNDQVPSVVNNTGTWVWLGGAAPLTNVLLSAVDEDSDENQLVFYVVGSRGGFPALKENPQVPLHNFSQAQIDQSLIVFSHKGQDMKPGSFDFEVSDGLNEAGKETFKVAVRKPELTIYDGRVSLPVFPFTQVPVKPENLLVRSSDARDVLFQVTSVPTLGQLVLEAGEGKFVSVSVFSQSDVSNGKMFYEHVKSGSSSGGQKSSLDLVRLTASSRFSDPLTNVTLEVEISVSGAALGGLQRYVTIQPLSVKEGGQVSITKHNINFTAVSEFISMQHRGNMWRGGLPTLRLLISEVPKHGWLIESDEHRLRPGAEIVPSLLSTESYLKYVHDDSETRVDQLVLSLWLHTTTNNSTWTAEDELLGGSSTWLLNITLPIQIVPVNDQPFSIVTPKAPISPVVQEHWRKITRNDLLTSDPDTPASYILYEVSKISHGRLILLSPNSTLSISSNGFSNEVTSGGGLSSGDIELLKELPSALKFTQADVDGGKVIFYHSGPILPVVISLQVSDGEHASGTVGLNIPVQSLTLQALQLQGSPMRIQQGNNMATLSLVNLPSQTNGHPARLQYNITRFPLHGKILFREKSNSAPVFSHQDLIQGELSYLQTDMSVTNDSFEVSAYFSEPELKRVTTTWLVNVVSIPLLKRVKEVRTFIKGFAVGGIIAPDEIEFSALYGTRTVLNLAVLDASPLATLTGANPIYEILLPPKFGQLYKIPQQQQQQNQPLKNSRYKRAPGGTRKASRFSHEDIRRGSIIYSPEIMSNEIIPSQIGTAQADEFIFKVLAPGVQPAIGMAKFHVQNGFYDLDKGHTEIISDGSTDPATKRSGGGAMRDITYLVTPQLSKDALIMIGVIIASVMTLSLFLVLGIRCTCSRKRGQQQPRRNSNNGGLNNGNGSNNPNKPTNGIGVIDAYAPTTTLIDQCHSSDPDVALRPLMMSTLSPRAARNKISMSRTGTIESDSGSWTSSMIRNDMPSPSVPQCRVTPLNNSSDSGGTSLMTCPLLAPTPICDTFCVLPEELDPPPEHSYGFSYGNLPPPLEIPELHEEETPFREFSPSNHLHHLNSSNSSTMTRGTMTLPHPHHNPHPLQNSSLHPNSSAGGTLKRQPGKNQYWV